MSRGLRSLGDSGLSQSSSPNPSTSNSASVPPVQTTPLLVRRGRPRKEEEEKSAFIPNATNTLSGTYSRFRMQPGVPVQFPNTNTSESTFEPISQVPYNRSQRAISLTNTNIGLGNRTPSIIGKEASNTSDLISTGRRGRRKKTAAMLYLESLGDNVDALRGDEIRHEASVANANYARSFIKDTKANAEYARSFISPESMVANANHARSFIPDFQANTEHARSFILDIQANAEHARSFIRPESSVANANHARSFIPDLQENMRNAQTHSGKNAILEKMPQGARENAIEHNLTREQVKWQLEVIDRVNRNQQQSTTQSLPKQDNPDAPDLDF
jgi:hypothetical protein